MSGRFNTIPTCHCARGVTGTFMVYQGGEWSPRYWRFKSTCGEPGGGSRRMKWHEDDELWNWDYDGYTPVDGEIVYSFSPGGRTPGSAEVVAEQVSIDDTDPENPITTYTEVARWVNRTWFDPHSSTAFRLKTATKIPEVERWANYACLTPSFGELDYNSCCGKYVLLVATIPEIRNKAFDGDITVVCASSPQPQVATYYYCGFGWQTPMTGDGGAAPMHIVETMQGTYLLEPSGLFSCVTGTGSHVIPAYGYEFTTYVEGGASQSGSDVALSIEASVSRSGGDFGNPYCGGAGPVCSQFQWQATLEDTNLCELLASGGSLTFSVQFVGGAYHPVVVENPIADATLQIIPIDVELEAPEEGYEIENCQTPLGPVSPGVCGGTSTWIMRRRCRNGDESIYYWGLNSHTCRGRCESDACIYVPPSELPLTHVSDEDAETAGYLALLDGDPQAGTCECEPNPEPVCASLCSDWVLRRTYCAVGDAYLYYWEAGENHCLAGCGETEACVPTVPFALPDVPIDDESAEAWPGGNLIELLNTTLAGLCECGADVYEAPECPPCNCDTQTANKTFTISGIASPNDVFNGTYTLVKGDLDCAFAPVTCCWYGCEEDFASCAILTFSGGTWFLTVQNGADYEVAGTECDDTIVLSKVTDFTTGSVMPATITVSTSP